MKKIKKKLIISVIICVVLAAGLYSVAMNTRKPVIIEFGMFTGSNWDVADANCFVLIDKAIKKFEEEHSGVKVHYTSGIPKEDYAEWLSEKMLRGEVPDVFMVLEDDFYKFSSLNLLEDVSVLSKEDKSFNKNIFFQSALDAGTYNGVQYALPYQVMPKLMFVNKTLLQKEGFEVPESNWTWEDLYNISKAVTKDLDGDGVLDQFGTYNYTWKEAAYSNGAQLFEKSGDKAYFTDKKNIEAVKYTKRLYDLNEGQKVLQDDFDAGNVAFMPLQFSEYRTYKTYPYKIKKYTSFKWDCITLPAGPSGDNISELNTLLVSVHKRSPNKQLAWEFLKLLTTDDESQLDILRYSQGASALKEVTRSAEAETIIQSGMEADERVIAGDVIFDVIEKGRVTHKFIKYKEALSLAEIGIAGILEEGNNIDSALKIIQRNVNHYLRE